MALIFALSAWMPLAETMCPKILIGGTVSTFGHFKSGATISQFGEELV